ncbi:MAG: cysteine--tRNA ligase [Phycisphaerales bacterium]|nr:cysteine--tRNA ligase [Phycisphaerales bacterium]
MPVVGPYRCRMPLVLYNTLTRSEQAFAPAHPPRVTFYSCGPTVYDFAHIGNFRSFLAADVLRRYLEFSGYQVRQVMNMTDVGHMVDDEAADGGGPDKLEIARQRLLESKKAGKLPPGVSLDPDDPYAIGSFYAEAFLADARVLGLKVASEVLDDPSIMPRPTQYVPQMIALTQKLIDTGHAYVASDGVVYFDVQSFPQYGQLSGNTLEQLRSGAGGRVDEANQAVKKHPADFMLWKPDPTHLMRWPSPWGEGYPGWHLECSAMALDLLARGGEATIDLHSGGEDNIFPHHECEIAQSRGATGADHFARHWFHPRHLFVEGQKMSKSKGTFFTVRDLLARGYGPAAIRLELIKTHYRSNANFTFQGLKDTQRMTQRWRAFVERGESSGSDRPADEAVLREFSEAMDSDLNIAGALGAINKWISQTPEPSRADAAMMRRLDNVLGVLELPEQADAALLDRLGIAPTGESIDAAQVERLIAERNAARAGRDFKRADAIRDELASMGIEIKDGPQGTIWTQRPR